MAFKAFAGPANPPLFLKEFAESVVQVEVAVTHASEGPVIFAGSGFLVKDPAGEIRVVFSFHAIDKILYGKNPKVSVEYKGRLFPLREGIALFPEEDLVAASVAWDSETLKGIVPLKVRDTFPEKGEAAYLWGFPGGQGKLKALMLGERGKGISARLFFLLRAGRASPQGASGGPVTDGRGGVFSVMVSTASTHNEGVGAGVLSRALSSAPEKTCFSPLWDCVLKARRDLYQKARRGDKTARRQLLKYHSWDDREGFDLFARSIGVSEGSAQKDYYDFLKGTAPDDLFAQRVLARLTEDPEDWREFRERSFQYAEEDRWQARYFAEWIRLQEEKINGPDGPGTQCQKSFGFLSF